MNNTNDNKISPLLTSTYFCERFYGMEMFCPIGENISVFQHVKIIDHSHFQVGDEILEYSDDGTISQYLFENLTRFTSNNIIFNPEYYINGEMYVNYHNGYVAKLKKFTPTELTFTDGYISDIHQLYMTERAYSGHRTDIVDIWLKLGENRIKDIVSNKQVISEDKLTKTYDYYIPSIIIYDLENGVITNSRKVSPDRTKINLNINNEWIDIHDNRYKYYQIKRTKYKVQLKEINIDDLKSDYDKSFDVNVIGENKLLVVRTFDDDKYFVSMDRDAEKIYSKDEDGNCRNILADEVSEIYIVDTSDIDNLIQMAKIIQLNDSI